MLSQIISSKLLNLTKSSTVFFIMLTFLVGNTVQASCSGASKRDQEKTISVNGTVEAVLKYIASENLFPGHTVVDKPDDRGRTMVIMPDKGVFYLGPDNESTVPVTFTENLLVHTQGSLARRTGSCAAGAYAIRVHTHEPRLAQVSSPRHY